MLVSESEQPAVTAHGTSVEGTRSAQVQQSHKRLLEDTFDIAPTGLKFCFDREYFLNDDFLSDEFILNQDAKGTSLEQMRDSLLQYSNILKSSLVELINQDYADFVNLSTNLVGLDKAIDAISTPLSSLESSVQEVLDELTSVETQLASRLEERQRIREKKELLNSLKIIDGCVSRLECWLSSTSVDPVLSEQYPTDAPPGVIAREKHANGTVSAELVTGSDTGEAEEEGLSDWPADFYADCSLHEDPGQRIDRVANEFIKLQFLAQKCQNHPVLHSLKPRIQWITSLLYEQLENRLKMAFEACQLTNQTERPNISKQSGAKLRQALSTYLVIDRLSDVIDLYRRDVLRPVLSQVFAARPELISKGSQTTEAVRVLDEMYSAALQVLDRQVGILNQLRIQCSSETYDPLAEFDCIVDGFWPETVDLLCSNLADMFSPGDPDRFYALYSCTLRFLDNLESKLGSPKALRDLRAHSSYSKFLNKWSLPVYFQIRFQEIAGCVEDEIMKGLTEAPLSPSNNCTSLSSLFSLMMPSSLDLLIVTRVVVAQLERCWQDGIYVVSLRHRFWKLTLQLLSRYRSFVAQQVGLQQSPSDSNATPILSANDLKPLLYLMVDCFQLIAYVRGTLLTLITNKLGPIDSSSSTTNQSPAYPSWLTESLDEACERIGEEAHPLQGAIVDQILRPCLNVSRRILDVPRQYRRTNRSLPTSPSAYVSAMVAPLSDLGQLCEKLVTKVPDIRSTLEELVHRAVTQLSVAYQGQLHELLGSVKKTEDSLRKIREARLAANPTGQTQTAPSSGTYSDDDKIRHQLYLDACGFRDQARTVWGVPKQANEVEETVKLVETAKNEAMSTER